MKTRTLDEIAPKRYLEPHICPICKKPYYPAPMHVYRVPTKGHQTKLVCSYTCMRKVEKEIEAMNKKGD